MKKLTCLMLVLVMMMGAMALAEGDEAAAAQLLEDVKGTYVALFPVITAPEYDQLWLDPCIEAVGEEAAPAVAEMLKTACSGTIYGQEAVDAFGDGSNDIELLRMAGLGVAMGNAAAAVKDAADLVTESNEDCGFARMIEKLLEERA